MFLKIYISTLVFFGICPVAFSKSVSKITAGQRVLQSDLVKIGAASGMILMIAAGIISQFDEDGKADRMIKRIIKSAVVIGIGPIFYEWLLYGIKRY